MYSFVAADAIQRLKRERGYDTGITALDLCSGKGGDLLKWKKGGIKKLICAGWYRLVVLSVDF